VQCVRSAVVVREDQECGRRGSEVDSDESVELHEFVDSRRPSEAHAWRNDGQEEQAEDERNEVPRNDPGPVARYGPLLSWREGEQRR
jgi:hypothetical protein